MKIVAFQIKNFRSIVDTGRIQLSNDNITALVGQNESGKSAVLDALALTFTGFHPVAEDCRYGEDLPEITIETQSLPIELEEIASVILDEKLRAKVIEKMKPLKGRLVWKFFVYKNDDDAYRITHIFDNLNFTEFKFDSAGLDGEALEEAKIAFEKDISAFRDAVFSAAPNFVPFDEDSGLLPNRIDVPATGVLKGVGSLAAGNFLSISGIKLKTLLASDTKAQTALLKRANKKITEDFRAFWKQNIGEMSGIELSCAIHQYSTGKEKQGQSFLEFLISDGENTLHPKQRSRGTRWFISFFLQLRAAAESDYENFFLLDEPGANLHERAQTDVMELVERISSKVGVIYSTHSPHLIRHDRLNRVIAVERDPALPGHPTKLMGAHALGGANIDTLSPVYVAMGVSLARQTAVKEKNNVILEELSAQYYLKAFWHLSKNAQEVHFLAATGASNIPMLANLFLGWGLEFLIVVDDEGTGRGVFNRLKRDVFLDDASWAKQRMYKLSGCDGIEDIFEEKDYTTFVAVDAKLGKDQRNSGWAKSHGAAKAIHAAEFLLKVESGEIRMESLHASTQERVVKTVEEISARLSAYADGPSVVAS
jgi:ABC-type ATPase involved in cell division